jgi:phage tail-like protein
MPLAKESLGLVNRFKVEIGGHELGNWSKCEGLDVAWETAEYRAGDSGNYRWYFPGFTKYSTIKVTRAASPESKSVHEWLQKHSFSHKKEHGKITLYDSAYKEVMSWDLVEVMPSKWSISPFDANGSSVAVETLELVHEGFLHDDKKV